MRLRQTIFAVCMFAALFQFMQAGPLCRLQSPDGRNVLTLTSNEKGELFYHVRHSGRTVIEDSPMGVRCEKIDLSASLSLHRLNEEERCRQTYNLLVGNKLSIDTAFNTRRIVLETAADAYLTIELAAGNEGIAFRYTFGRLDDRPRTVLEEKTGFKIAAPADGWMQPYHAAGNYSPAYEDFYYPVRPLDAPGLSRERSRGWALPALFHVPDAASWILIAESGLDGTYCASHLEAAADQGVYQIALAYEDEMTGAKQFNADAKTASVLTAKTPWRIIIIGDQPADIFNATLVTDLAAPSQIEDAAWVQPGRASWSWWSQPDDKDTTELYNSFTDLAAAFGWEYTLFDAGWWNADLQAMCRYANTRGVKPLVWMHAVDFYDAEKRKRKLDDLVDKGVKGIKVDFWCSDRQETVAAMMETLKDAATRRLVVSFHGCTIPRGWHRTWPNLLTAEAVLGTECYFFEKTYPEKVAQLSTILPLTRNVMAPMDTTPVALTVRKFPRKTTAAFELAASIVFTSGIIHYADSVEVFNSLPSEVKDILRDAPATWDETICLAAEPGKNIVIARRKAQEWFIAGLNGTDKPISVGLDLARFRHLKACEIKEGENALMDFSARTVAIADWHCHIDPFGGFVLRLQDNKTGN